ncbi:hypothetical protein ACFLQL_02020 [Verrucomicrobiota bacterium]
MLSSTIIYLELFIVLFFLPGFFITVILGIKKFRFLLSFALSYSLLVLTFLPFEYYAQPIARWETLLLWVGGGLGVLAVAKALLGQKSFFASIRAFFNSPRWLARLMVPLVLAGVICGYLAYAGPYLEIPADAWEHVRRFQWFETGATGDVVFNSDSSIMSLLIQRLRWYFFHAWLGHIAGLSVMDSLYILTFVNVLVFLLAIYYFGLFLFAGLRISAFKKMMMAASASLFAGATMGNMVFAYIRYYAFAPTILNYVLFLAAMAVIIAWLRSNRWRGYALWIAPLLLVVTCAIHTQETLFIFFMTLALILAETARLLWQKIVNRTGQSGCDNHWTAKEWKPLILGAVLLFVFFAGFAAIRYVKPGAWISSAMIMPHVVVPTEPVNFIFRNLIISVPENLYLRLAVYQLFVFYQVVGCWGLFVYLLFALIIRRFIKIPYLTAGMIFVPLLTAFNPLTVDMLVRLGQSSAIYRFHYLIPLPFVGGYLFVRFWDKARDWFHRMRPAPLKRVSPFWPRLAWINFAGCVLVLAGLIGLVFPINAAGIYAPYSKIYTLRKIPAGNDYRLYADLEEFIAKYENKVILSDGWTAGFLSYFAPKNTYGWLRWFSSLNPEKDHPDPYTWEDLSGRGLIVVNCRDGAPSITGRIARHWPENTLKVSRPYSLEARNYLESHPETFQKIWSQNQIAVYVVR